MVPILDEISKKGIYIVLLRFIQLPIDQSGSVVEIVFLNASVPVDMNFTSMQNVSTGPQSQVPAIAGPYKVPASVLPLIPVKSFDMIIYSNDGKEIWKKTDQLVHGGSAFETIAFNYTGPITIELNNIKPDPGINQTVAAAIGNANTTDSVKFTTTAVPEFPVFSMLPLAIGAAAVIALLRLRAGAF